MSRLNEQEEELLSIIENVKGKLTYYASRYRNNGTKGLLLPGTDSAIQKAITLICCLENQIKRKDTPYAKQACECAFQECSRLSEEFIIKSFQDCIADNLMDTIPACIILNIDWKMK